MVVVAVPVELGTDVPDPVVAVELPPEEPPPSLDRLKLPTIKSTASSV